MKLTVKNQIILAAAGVVVVFVAAVFLVIWPQVRKIGELGDKIEAQDAAIASAKDVLSRRIEARDNASKTNTQYILLTNRVPDSPELPALIIEMQDAADLAGLKLIKIAPEAATMDQGTYTAYQIKLDLEGRWADVIDFTRRLDKMTRGVRVVSAEVRNEEAGQASAESTAAPEPVEVNVNTMLEVYTVNPSSATSAAPAVPQ